jgi:hypothetical protein
LEIGVNHCSVIDSAVASRPVVASTGKERGCRQRFKHKTYGYQNERREKKKTIEVGLKKIFHIK